MKKALILCNCGHTQDKILDFDKIKNSMKGKYPILEYESLCQKKTLEKAMQEIKDNGYEAVVFGACTPKILDPLIQKKMKEISYEIVPLKEHCAIPHVNDAKGAAQKALNLLNMNLETIDNKEKLEIRNIELKRSVLVIGGGIAGIVSSSLLNDNDIKVHLIEKQDILGGKLNEINKISPSKRNAIEVVTEKLKLVENKERISIYLNSEIKEIKGSPGNYSAIIANPEGEISIEVGAIIISTGISEITPSETNIYKNIPDIINQSELSKMLLSGEVIKPSTNEEVKKVLMVNCVGSRDDDNPDCSRICCSISINHANELIDMGIETSIAYMDIRTPYLEEIEYQKARTKGVNFIKGIPSIVELQGDNELHVAFEDTISSRILTFQPDLIVISGYLKPNDPSLPILKDIRVNIKESGYIDNLYSKLATNETKEKGIFLAGTAFNPMKLDEVIASASSAAFKIVKFFKKDTYSKKMNVPVVNTETCEGCKTCSEVCPFGAITLIDEKAVIDPLICTGCGTCTVFCHVRALELPNYSYSILSSKIENLLKNMTKEERKDTILGITCQECAYCVLDVAGMTKYEYPSNTYFIDVPCASRISFLELLKPLNMGVGGILVAACPEDSCHYQKGSSKAKNLVDFTNKILMEIGYPDKKIFFDTFVSNEPEKLVKVINNVNKNIKVDS